MADPFIGEIRMFGGNFAPVGWALCNGQLIAISENATLYNLIGTTYGGDGVSTFALPNLQSRVPIHSGTARDGNQYVIGQAAGVEQVTLNTTTIAQHTHVLSATNASPTNVPGPTAFPAAATSTQTGVVLYGAPLSLTNLNPNTIGFAGGSQPHENRQPYLAVTFIIALFGIFPSQN